MTIDETKHGNDPWKVAEELSRECDQIRAINAVLLAAVIAAQEFMGGFFGDKEMEANEITPVRKQLADAIAKAEANP